MLKRIIYLILISTTISFSQSLPDNLGQPVITGFQARRYHAHPNNFDVVQDKDGILYFGNLWCVLQFDGTLWRTIYLPLGASCTSLAIDKDGTIYVGGRNSVGYLKKDSIGRMNYVSLLEELPKEDQSFNEIWRTVVTPDGVFFAGFEKLFFKKHGEKLKVLRRLSWYAFGVLNHVYISDKEGLFTYQNNQLQKVASEYFTGKFVTCMTHLGKDLLICTSSEGLCVYDGTTVQRWNTPINDVIRSFNPTKMENIDEKYLIISTELNGVIITDIKGNIIAHFNKSNGLTANTVSGFFLGRNKILWLTLANEIASIPLFKQISFINDYANVPGVPYSSALYDHKLYLATSEGLFSKPLSAEGKFNRVSSGLVWDLQVIDDKLFCGEAITSVIIDYDKTETLFNEGTWTYLPSSEKDKILMGTYSGLHYLEKKNGRWVYANKIKGFNESAKSFTEDKLGDIWVSHDNRGVFKLRINKETDSVTQIKKFTADSGLPLKNGSTIARFQNDILITTEGGVYRYDFETEKILPYEMINKVLSKYGYANVKKIVPELPNKLWLIDKQGSIIKLKITDNHITTILTTELIRNNTISDFEHLNPFDNAAIIGTLDGFAIYREIKDSTQQDSLSAFISRIESNKRILADGNYHLTTISSPIPFSENALKFTFASNAYQDLNSNQFQYYLEGFEGEKKWSASTYIPYKEYTNLHAGNYKLHVRLIDPENKVSNETTLSFVILPPWYQSWWAYILYGIIFILLNYLFFRWMKIRIEKAKRRIALEEQHNLWLRQREWEEINLNNKKEMMTLQQEKLLLETAALEEKERLMEKEKERERQILAMEKEKLEADIHYKNNELTSLTLHITQKNEMLTKIGNQLNRAIQECRDEETIKGLKEIKNSLQKGLNSENEWEKFTDHFDTVHEGFLKRLKQRYPDLSSSTLKLCAFIKMRLSSKQIATLMNTAPDSVLKARYRLRTKFGLEKETGLEEFLNNF